MLVTTGLVFAMVTHHQALFFFFVDQIISLGVRALFGSRWLSGSE